MGCTFDSSWADMKIVLTFLVIGILATLAQADGGQRHGRGGRRQGRRQRPRAGRQQNFDLGPPPQPVINLPPSAAAPLPLPAGPPNRFLPTGPAPGSSLPPESLVAGHIPDRDGNYDFEFETDEEFRREEGRVKNGNTNEISGEYSWTSPEGELVSFTYIADENGYQAQGSHLPEAPPLHPHVQRGLELIARVNQRNRNRNRT